MTQLHLINYDHTEVHPENMAELFGATDVRVESFKFPTHDRVVTHRFSETEHGVDIAILLVGPEPDQLTQTEATDVMVREIHHQAGALLSGQDQGQPDSDEPPLDVFFKLRAGRGHWQCLDIDAAVSDITAQRELVSLLVGLLATYHDQNKLGPLQGINVEPLSVSLVFTQRKDDDE